MKPVQFWKRSDSMINVTRLLKGYNYAEKDTLCVYAWGNQ